MLRRKKADVLSELPPIIRRIVPLCPDIGSNFLNILRAYAKGEKSLANDRAVLIQNALKEFANSAQEKARLPELEDYITNMLRQNGGKVVIFARHHVLIDAIREILNECSLEYITITGKTRQDDRQYLIDKFNTEEYCKVAILSLGVGCEGINMQSASLAIVAELDWSPNVLAQAESRLHRIGQKGSVVISYLLYGQFEDKLYQVLAKKSKVIGGVIDGNYTEDNLDLLQALVEDMRN
jgi:SWI/SNF-related matrix-associated actin-dependent regulator 1 of chromatin subfamily A